MKVDLAQQASHEVQMLDKQERRSNKRESKVQVIGVAALHLTNMYVHNRSKASAKRRSTSQYVYCMHQWYRHVISYLCNWAVAAGVLLWL